VESPAGCDAETIAHNVQDRVPFPSQCIMNKYRYFLIGVLLILLGVQFRLVQSFTLNESSTRTLARLTDSEPQASSDPIGAAVYQNIMEPKQRFEPPRWLGLAMIAAGIVASFHSFALPKQG
ncbi:MAG: hypothetical protein AAFN70_21065, partial [Planctomycetota bacterium]